MPEDTRISIFEVVGSSLCAASDDGRKVYEYINTVLEADQVVTLSFRNVTTLTAAFLSASIGHLYETFSDEQIQLLLKVEDMEQDDLALLNRVINTAKLYFKEPRRFDQIVQGKFDQVVLETLGNKNDEAQSTGSG